MPFPTIFRSTRTKVLAAAGTVAVLAGVVVLGSGGDTDRSEAATPPTGRSSLPVTTVPGSTSTVTTTTQAVEVTDPEFTGIVNTIPDSTVPIVNDTVPLKPGDVVAPPAGWGTIPTDPSNTTTANNGPVTDNSPAELPPGWTAPTIAAPRSTLPPLPRLAQVDACAAARSVGLPEILGLRGGLETIGPGQCRFGTPELFGLLNFYPASETDNRTFSGDPIRVPGATKALFQERTVFGDALNVWVPSGVFTFAYPDDDRLPTSDAVGVAARIVTWARENLR